MTNPTSLTADELRAIAYFSVGVTSEGSVAGRAMAYRLSFAGSVGRDGRMNPVGNSGYSFGTLQIDLGQHPDVARDLLDSFQRWAATQTDHGTLRLSDRTYESTLDALQRTGRQMHKNWGQSGLPCTVWRQASRSRLSSSVKELGLSKRRAFVGRYEPTPAHTKELGPKNWVRVQFPSQPRLLL